MVARRLRAPLALIIKRKMEIILIVLLILVGYRFLKKNDDSRIRLDLENGFKFLLIWIILGFLTRLDYSDRWGCVIGFEPILEPRNIIFSTISFVLILIAFQIDKHKVKRVLCLTEFLYWIVKLMAFKGGYVVGYGGVPDVTIVLYDLISIVSRLFVIQQILNIERFKVKNIVITAALIMAVKISIFRTPMNMVYEERLAFREAEKIRKELVGGWNGIVEKIEGEEIETQEDIYIQIDSNTLLIDKIEELEGEYRLVLKYPEYGILSSEAQLYNYNIFLEKNQEDSLVMTIYDASKQYKFRLRRD